MASLISARDPFRSYLDEWQKSEFKSMITNLYHCKGNKRHFLIIKRYIFYVHRFICYNNLKSIFYLNSMHFQLLCVLHGEANSKVSFKCSFYAPHKTMYINTQISANGTVKM